MFRDRKGSRNAAVDHVVEACCALPLEINAINSISNTIRSTRSPLTRYSRWVILPGNLPPVQRWRVGLAHQRGKASWTDGRVVGTRRMGTWMFFEWVPEWASPPSRREEPRVHDNFAKICTRKRRRLKGPLELLLFLFFTVLHPSRPPSPAVVPPLFCPTGVRFAQNLKRAPAIARFLPPTLFEIAAGKRAERLASCPARYDTLSNPFPPPLRPRPLSMVKGAEARGSWRSLCRERVKHLALWSTETEKMDVEWNSTLARPRSVMPALYRSSAFDGILPSVLV